MTWLRPTMTGDTAATVCDSLRILSASARVSVAKAWAPWLTPPLVLAPGVMTIMFVPRLLICSRIRERAP